MGKQGTYYAYTRVSTAKQGTRGVSLQEQKYAIERYAKNNGLEISEWFEERVTAAKSGRVLFGKMLKKLQARKANGVIIHKIDRSARNLRDWADLGELIDRGIQVHFANESLDMTARGGRLSADIQAVVAADYIRNLREEARKGIYGRLKQGYYPMQAPIGYVDCGGGKDKLLDPVKAPLVRNLFKAYATGMYNIDELVQEARASGLTNRAGGAISKNGMWKTLRNPFYIGLMHIRRTNKTFDGRHTPLISTKLFYEVQNILDGRSNAKLVRHDYVFRRLFRCALCAYSMIGERQKGHVYYRCHTPGCATTSVREEWIHHVVVSRIASLSMTPEVVGALNDEIRTRERITEAEVKNYIRALSIQRRQIETKLSRLIDLLIDGKIEEKSYNIKRDSILRVQKVLDEKCAAIQSDSGAPLSEVRRILEYLHRASLPYRLGSKDEKRELIKALTSNRSVYQKKVFVELGEPYKDLINRPKTTGCGGRRDVPRTAREIVDYLVKYVRDNPLGDISRSP